MGLGNTATGWGWPARLLHWLMAGLILFQLGIGFRMVNLVSDVALKFGLYQTHKSWGFVIFCLALVRIGWRLVQPAPLPPPGTPRGAVAMARAAHIALYVLMIVLPLSGWLTASASPLQDTYGLKNLVFTWFELPDPIRPGSEALEDRLATVHAWAAFGLAVILLGHVAAAFWHHLRRRDGVLRRMVLGQ